jgi:hypothetical protein
MIFMIIYSYIKKSNPGQYDFPKISKSLNSLITP